MLDEHGTDLLERAALVEGCDRSQRDSDLQVVRRDQGSFVGVGVENFPAGSNSARQAVYVTISPGRAIG